MPCRKIVDAFAYAPMHVGVPGGQKSLQLAGKSSHLQLYLQLWSVLAAWCDD